MFRHLVNVHYNSIHFQYHEIPSLDALRKRWHHEDHISINCIFSRDQSGIYSLGQLIDFLKY